MTLDPAAIIARVPRWAGRRDIQISTLDGGLTNHNYRVDVDGESFVLRICGAQSELLGIDREQEYAAHLTAAHAGLAPEVIAFLQPEGYLVTRYIAGDSFMSEQMRERVTMERICEMLRRVHELPAIAGDFSPFRRITAMSEVVLRQGLALPTNWNWLVAGMHEAERALTHPAEQLRLCHNDLGRKNFFDQRDQLLLIDWEFAGMGDIFFDLATFALNHSFDDAHDQTLLESYFGHATPSATARLGLMKIIATLHEALWCAIQAAISQIDLPFEEYAEADFALVTAAMQDARWPQWLALAAEEQN